ncbi:MAG: hypothetical protein WC100_18475 [Sterolibacterium sp.]
MLLRKPDISPFAADSRIDHGFADREVVDVLELHCVEAQSTVNLIVEVAADASALNTGCFGFQVECIVCTPLDGSSHESGIPFHDAAF